MKQIKRAVALIIAFVLVLGFSGCGRLQIEKELLSFDGEMVSVAEYKYYLENIKAQMLTEAAATDEAAFWNGEIDGKKATEVAKERALAELIRIEIACAKAEEKGIRLDSSVLAQIKQTVTKPQAEFKGQLDSIKSTTGLSDQGLIALLGKTELAAKYAQDLMVSEADKLAVTDKAIAEKYQESYSLVKHISVLSQQQAAEGEEQIDAETFKTQQKARAEEVLAKVKAGANFESLLKEYGEDPGMEQQPEGYMLDSSGYDVISQGTMVSEFTQGAFSIGVGQTTDLVETPYGWHILKRYKLPTSGEAYESATQTVKGLLMQDKYNALVDTYKPDFDIQIDQKEMDGLKVY